MSLISHFVELDLNPCLNACLFFMFTGEVSFLSQEDQRGFKRLQLQARKPS